MKCARCSYDNQIESSTCEKCGMSHKMTTIKIVGFRSGKFRDKIFSSLGHIFIIFCLYGWIFDKQYGFLYLTNTSTFFANLGASITLVYFYIFLGYGSSIPYFTTSNGKSSWKLGILTYIIITFVTMFVIACLPMYMGETKVPFLKI